MLDSVCFRWLLGIDRREEERFVLDKRADRAGKARSFIGKSDLANKNMSVL